MIGLLIHICYGCASSLLLLRVHRTNSHHHFYWFTHFTLIWNNKLNLLLYYINNTNTNLILFLKKKHPYRELNPDQRIESPMNYLYSIWICLSFPILLTNNSTLKLDLIGLLIKIINNFIKYGHHKSVSVYSFPRLFLKNNIKLSKVWRTSNLIGFYFESFLYNNTSGKFVTFCKSI